MRIGLDGKEKIKRYWDWYLFAVLIGIGIFLVSLISIKILFFLGKIIFNNWMWFVAGIIGIFLLNRYFKKPKKIKREIDPYEYQD